MFVTQVSFAATFAAGVASVDITPTTPIRLSGYGNRTEETTEIKQRLFVKALALRAEGGEAAVLITVDNCAVNLKIAGEACGRIAGETGVPRERVAINFSHTHCAPMLSQCIPNLFGKPIPPEHQAHIDAYTATVIDAMARAAGQAVAGLAPAELYFGIGAAGFGTNRRTPGGPTDHDLPVLVVKAPDGAVRAVVAGYACHCTTMSLNFVHGDWAGCAQAALEAAYPGAVGMVVVGCGGDQNPMPRGTIEHAEKYGLEIAAGAKQAIDSGLRRIDAQLACALKQTPLAFAPAPGREEWERRAKEDTPPGYHARVQLEKLNRGEALATEIPYTVQVWNFGEQLAMLFLAGEVVVDYSTRFKLEYDRNRLWVSGYSNDVPCYIPSARILKEGGYEGCGAMVYYDQPNCFAPDVEDRIAAAVHELMPASFKNDHAKTNGFPPLSPHDALAAFDVRDGYEVQLVACEPQVVSPVAIDFAPDGALFVAEMYDYNIPPKENVPPRGRIRRLTDTNGDGFYDQSGVFLDNVPYPTGVTAWRDGVLVCAAPDIILAEDTNHDGVADTRKVLFTGFTPANFQARVNSLSWGLDNWMYGGGGLLGGLIKNPESDAAPSGLGSRDFRFNPDTLDFETATGNSQYGRARDDYDNWFGCDSSVLLKYYALPEHELKKAPGLVPPDPIVTLAGPPYDVYPVSSYVERMNDPDDLNRITSACGLAIYRDDLLGPEFTGNAFNCEPVHNLVTRLVVEPKGASFTAHRATGEEQREFLASRDHWFRPSQVRTGPDGALWVVDMYRYVIEHEKWITPDRREALDMFAGKEMGRIYRVLPKGVKPRPIPNLAKMDAAALVQALNTPNGTVRDLAHQVMLWRNDAAAVEPLKAMALDDAAPPVARTHALCVLDGMGHLDKDTLVACARSVPSFKHDPPADSPEAVKAKWVKEVPFAPEADGLRRHVNRLLGTNLADAEMPLIGSYTSAPVALAGALALSGVSSSDSINLPRSLATMLVQWSEMGARQTLSRVSTIDEAIDSNPPIEPVELIFEGPNANAVKTLPDPYVATSVLIAASKLIEGVIDYFVDQVRYQGVAPEIAVRGLAALAAEQKREGALRVLLTGLAENEDVSSVQIVLDQAFSQGFTVEQLLSGKSSGELVLVNSRDAFAKVIAKARETLGQADVPIEEKIAALQLLVRVEGPASPSAQALIDALGPQSAPKMQAAALKALSTRNEAETGAFLVAQLENLGPETRNAALDVLIRRPAWCGLLLDALAARPELRAGLNAERKQFLTRHPDLEVRERAVALLGAAASSGRAELVAKYTQAIAAPGDAARGVPIFEERCGQCHQLGKVGHALGPDLSALTDKSPAALVKAILDPNETVLEQYQAFDVETNDLRTLTAVVAEESANSITLKMAGGTEETLQRSGIARMNNTARSLMPEGLEENLSPDQLADVIAFVQSNAPVAKQFKGNAPARVLADAAGHYALTAENSAIYGGPEMEYRPRFGAIGGWSTPADHAEWQVEVAAAGDYAVEMTWTSPLSAKDSPWKLTCGAATLEGVLPTTGGYENFVLRELGTLRLEAGVQTLTFAPTSAVKDGMMELRAITLKKK